MEKGTDTTERISKQLRQAIRVYREIHPWHRNALHQHGQQGKEIYNGLRRVAYNVLNNRDRIADAANLIGAPFEKYYPPHDPNRAKKLFKKLNEIHPITEGKRTYLSPWEVKQEHPGIYQQAIKLFGNYRSALNAWQKKAYEKSVTRHNPDIFPKEDLLSRAKRAVQRVFRQHGYVSLFHLRNSFPQAYREISAGMERKHYHYEWLVKAAGFKPVAETERNMLGQAGELFSFAALFIAQKEVILPFFPGYGGRVPILAPNNKKSKTGLTHPDIGFSDNGTILRVKEVKAGLYFDPPKAHDAITKYSSTPDNPLRFSEHNTTPVIFDSIDLHFSPNRLPQESLDAFSKANIRVHTPAYFDELFQGELADTYHSFIRRPLPFVRRKHFLHTLEDLVLATAPPNVQENVQHMRNMSTHQRQQRRNELKEEAPF